MKTYPEDNLKVKFPSGRVLEIEPPRPGLSDRGKAELLRGHLDLIMSQIDYTRGACDNDTKIGILVRPDYLESVRRALELTK